MATMRDIKGRIRSVTTTKKTTKAMNLVSSAKMARARGKLNAANPYFKLVRRAISEILHTEVATMEHPVFEGEREIKKTLVVVIANDRGLCGGYNANVTKLAANLAVRLTNEGKEVAFLTIGNKARDFMRRAGGNIIAQYNGISESPTIEDAREIIADILSKYENEECDEVFVCFTEFKSAISYIPQSLRFLPMSPKDFTVEKGRDMSIMKFEPSAKEVLGYAIPKYLGTAMYECMITSAASGQGATMTAMDSATENAENIIGDLTLMLNRVRQAAITQEISEIVGGANALE
ncbi:MAG: ATP synthase F1 subunit gamma [Defluviitaleaceae bacterium]|nr:ATP synthase F1 subunit gamma [Defluviitaleaceae bacterium]